MIKSESFSKPIVDFKVTTWGATNFLTGVLLAKVVSYSVFHDSKSATISKLGGDIFSFLIPVFLFIGLIAFFSYLRLNKLEKDFDGKLISKKEFDIFSLILNTIKNGIFFILYGGISYSVLLMFLTYYVVSPIQFGIFLNAVLPFQWSISIFMCLVWGNIVKLDTHYNLR
ncbi:hypothetical protein AMD27_16705 (plasmid) [Acinetobacter sp. TGL-Y2]|uniref:hypothetical protein n=1 Tax=Acinetobacter sp. TGL-Y2 TaxID=1407071 RepID=UPI0007A66670|nr:hypothetical protein [Acinetobacter sp. TGL-Y2]AMW80557.1 hypothetical protein AMD27_16705 [Acinetobacter sp. TGL-Y2]